MEKFSRVQSFLKTTLPINNKFGHITYIYVSALTRHMYGILQMYDNVNICSCMCLLSLRNPEIIHKLKRCPNTIIREKIHTFFFTENVLTILYYLFGNMASYDSLLRPTVFSFICSVYKILPSFFFL